MRACAPHVGRHMPCYWGPCSDASGSCAAPLVAQVRARAAAQDGLHMPLHVLHRHATVVCLHLRPARMRSRAIRSRVILQRQDASHGRNQPSGVQYPLAKAASTCMGANPTPPYSSGRYRRGHLAAWHWLTHSNRCSAACQLLYPLNSKHAQHGSDQQAWSARENSAALQLAG